MKFRIIRQLKTGQYYCSITLEEFSPEDQEKFAKYGVPLLNIKSIGAKSYKVPITQLNQFQAFGFPDSKSADEYVDDLKKQILDLKSSWAALKDAWSGDEII